MTRKSKHHRILCQHFTWIIYRRSNGVFYADGRGNSPDLGKISLGTKNRDETDAALRELDRFKAQECGLTTNEIAETLTQISVEEGWKIFMDMKQTEMEFGRFAESSFKRYRAVRDLFVKFTKSHRITRWDKVTKEVVENFAQWMGKQKYHKIKDYAISTLEYCMGVIRTVNHSLVKEKYLGEESKLTIHIPKSDESDAYRYSREEVKAILDLSLGIPKLHWLHDLLQFLSMTGVRISEAAGLRWSDLDWESRFVHIKHEGKSKKRITARLARTTKGKRSRVIPLHEKLSGTLQSIEKHRDGFVFHGPRGGKLKPDTVLTVFKREVLKKLEESFPTPEGEIGFEDGRIHSFRHYFISECFRQGVTESQIMDWAGHKQSRIIARYRHLRPEDGKSKMASLVF